MKLFKRNIILYIFLIIALCGSIFELYQSLQKNTFITQNDGDFSQPPLKEGRFPWSVRSVDTQVISKHWPKVTRDSIKEQVKLIADLGVNYIAIGTSYDRVDEMRMWAEEIHGLGLNVWFRSHWDEWEGDDGKPATLSPDEYLNRTSQFIKNNPDLFLPGDSFTVAVEPEQVGVGLGKRFLTWDQYRNFLLSQVVTANEAFDTIGLKGKVHTNWLSVNGWIVENQFTPELVSKLGLITVDHFVGQNKTIGDFSDSNTTVKMTLDDLDSFNKKWNVPILLGEWGYQIFQPVSEDLQDSVINDFLGELTKRKYLVGINYWVHMGNTASLIGDEYGTNLKYHKAALTIQSFYDPLTASKSEKIQKIK